MERVIYGSVVDDGLEVVQRDGRYYVRYDAGAHVNRWREDEISLAEFEQLKSGASGEYKVLLDLEKRLRLAGEDPYSSNWSPA